MILRIANWVLVAGYVLAVALGAIQFSIWSQIDDLEGTEVSVEFVFGNPHGPRFALMAPVLFLAGWLEHDADYIFSLVTSGLVVLTGVLIGNAIQALAKSRSQFAYALGIVPAIGISLFMHGRIAYAFAGFAILLSGLLIERNTVADAVRLYLRTLLSIALSAVSSGTIMVVTFTAVVVVASAAVGARGMRIRGRAATALAILYAILLAAVVPFLWLLIEKNVSFYGEGILGARNMLAHGAGKLLVRMGTEVALPGIAFVGAAACLVFAASVRFVAARPVIVALGWSALGGLFGYSTLSMGFIPLAILFGVLALGFSSYLSSFTVPAQLPVATKN